MMAKRQAVKKTSAFTSWIKSKVEVNLPYAVSITSVEKDPYRSDGAVLHFKLTSDNITTSDDDAEFDNIVDEIYNVIDSIQAVSDAGYQEALNEKEFTWLVYDDRMDANYEASTKKSKGGKMTMKNKNGMKKFRSNLYSRIQSIADRAGCVDGAYEECEQMGIDTYSDNESTLYNAVENSIDQLDEDLSRLQDYLEDMGPKSTKKSKYARLHKALNKIGGFTKEDDEEEIEIDDDDVVEIEDDEDGKGKVVEIESEETHAEEVADGEESEDDNLNAQCKGCKSAKAFRTSKRVKMKKGEDMPADADDFQNDNQKGSGNAGSELPEDADDQQEINEKGSGNAGSELPEDADEQEDQKQAKARKMSFRNKNVRKFSVTPGGSPNQESYAQKYPQAPMTRQAIDRHFSAKSEKSFDEVAMLQERIDNLNKSKRNKTNNGVPLKLRKY